MADHIRGADNLCEKLTRTCAQKNVTAPQLTSHPKRAVGLNEGGLRREWRNRDAVFSRRTASAAMNDGPKVARGRARARATFREFR